MSLFPAATSTWREGRQIFELIHDEMIKTVRKQLDAARAAGGGLVMVLPAAGADTFRTLADDLDIRYINLSLELSRRLLDVPIPARSGRVFQELSSLLGSSATQVAVGHLGLLHLRELQMDAVRAMEQLARAQVVLAEWDGDYDGRALTYAEPGHGEYRRWDNPRFPVVDLREGRERITL